MIDPSAMANLYDFSLIERAVQTYFCQDAIGLFTKPVDDNDPAKETWTPSSGLIPVFTAFQAATFRKNRPRVGLDLNNINAMPAAQIVDADDVIRTKAWTAALRFNLVTEANYITHTQLRAMVAGIIPQLAPRVRADGTGILDAGANLFLTYHEIGRVELADNSTHIAPQEGAYSSALNCVLAFSVRATAWPGGT